MKTMRTLLGRTLLFLLLVAGAAGFLLEHATCVAHERPSARAWMESLIDPEPGPDLPTAEEFEAPMLAASPVLTR
jgi:hypothetical protein